VWTRRIAAAISRRPPRSHHAGVAIGLPNRFNTVSVAFFILASMPKQRGQNE
jgi:hypothetical protein